MITQNFWFVMFVDQANEVSNLTWAFATQEASACAKPLFEVLGGAAVQSMKSFKDLFEGLQKCCSPRGPETNVLKCY